MRIETLEDLERLIDLCTRKNVYTVTVGDVSLNINIVPKQATPQEEKPVSEERIDPATGLPMSDEEWKFFEEAYAAMRKS